MIPLVLVSLLTLGCTWVITTQRNLAYAPIGCAMAVGMFPFWSDDWLDVCGMAQPVEVSYPIYLAFLPILGAVLLFRRNTFQICITYCLILLLFPLAIDITSDSSRSGVGLSSLGSWMMATCLFTMMCGRTFWSYLPAALSAAIFELGIYYVLAEMIGMDTVTLSPDEMKELTGYYLSNAVVALVLVPLFSIPIWWRLRSAHFSA